MVSAVLLLFAIQAPSTPGLTGPVGPRKEARQVAFLDIRKPGVYEDLLVDVGWADRDAVKIRADNVTLRHCEIRNGRKDAVEVYAKDVLIESCRIHHFLAGTFTDQKDAHGITGRPTRLTIRNCEIYLVSGDATQFDPGRGPWTEVLIENCVFWTAPLKADAAGFKKGERPGENGVDTKTEPKGARPKLVIRNTVFHGWKQKGQISNMAAINLKENVDVRIENCVFYDNEIGLRLRGRTKRGTLNVTAKDCSFYSTEFAVRAEDGLEDLKLINPAFASDVGRKVRFVGKQGRGFEMTGERKAPPLKK